MSKYRRLAEYLDGLTMDRVELSLTDIENILGFSLPSSAKKAVWWANDRTKTQAVHGWLSAGWIVESVNMRRGLISFRRTGEKFYGKLPVREMRRLKPEPLPLNEIPGLEEVYTVKHIEIPLYTSSGEFEEVAAKIASEWLKVKLVSYRGEELGEIDFMSQDRKIIGAALHFSKHRHPNISTSRLAIITHTLWILESVDAERRIMVIGGEDYTIPHLWLTKYQKIIQRNYEEKRMKTEILFLNREGKLYRLNPEKIYPT